MNANLLLHQWTARLTVAALVLPIVVCVLVGVAGLLTGMGDHQGGNCLYQAALFGGIFWGIDLICLLLLLAMRSLLEKCREPNRPEQEERVE